MRVLQLGKFYPPKRGGIETITEVLSTELVKRGHDVTVLCANDVLSTVYESAAGVKIIRVASLGILFSQPILPTLPFHLYRAAKKVDIVHLHSPNPLVEFFVLLLLNQKVVISYHADVTRQKKLLRLYSAVRNAVFVKSKKIIVAAEKLKTSSVLEKYQEKIKVIPFGLPSELFHETEVIKKHAAEIFSKHGSYILFVGRLVKYKGLDFLLKAMSKVDGTLLIVGEGPEKNKLKKLTKDLGLTKKVVFLGGVDSYERLAAYYKTARFLVLPSINRAEAFGLVLIEAMAWKKPLISSDLDTGISEVNVEGVTGFIVRPGHIEDLERTINQLIENDELCSRLASNGYARYLEKYTAEQMSAAYEAIYLEAIQNE